MEDDVPPDTENESSNEEFSPEAMWGSTDDSHSYLDSDSESDSDTEDELSESFEPIESNAIPSEKPSSSSSVESVKPEPMEMPKPMLDPSRMYSTQAFILKDTDPVEEEGSESEGEGGGREADGGDDDDDNATVAPSSIWILDVIDLSVPEQEQAVLQELLYILNGVGGDLIPVHKISKENIGFKLDEDIAYPLRDLTMEIAHVGAYYHRIQKFIEAATGLEYGRVNHALVAGMRELVEEYLLCVSQLETIFADGKLTLLEFWFYFHETVEQMSVMCEFVIDMEKEKSRGGFTLTILHVTWVKVLCEPVAKLTCHLLATKASAPYFRIIEKWIYTGVIDDPFNEFYISHGDTTGCTPGEDFKPREDYWETRYICDLTKCPNFLRKTAMNIFRAGKYLNVLLQCEPTTQLLQEKEIPFSVQAHDYVEYIETPYSYASLTLLDLMETKYDLRRKLRTVKGCLFLEQGDAIADLLDLARDDLCKPFWMLNETRLQSLLEWVLFTSSSTIDGPYKDNFKIQVFSAPIREMFPKVLGTDGIVSELDTFEIEDVYTLPGIRMFSLNCKFDWPASIVFNKEIIATYQYISRHLLYCKHVERRLCELWFQEKNKKMGMKDLKSNLEQATRFSLRHQMLAFVQHLLYYTTMEVIDQEWEIFLEKMETAECLDRVMRLHSNFLKTVLHDSMLNNSGLLGRMTGLLTICLEFCNKYSDDLPSAMFMHENPMSKEKKINEMDAEFNKNLLEFMTAAISSLIGPQRSRKIINLIYRINLNGYYAKALSGFSMPTQSIC